MSKKQASEMKGEPILHMQNICKNYRQGRSNIEVLRGVELKLFSGEMVAIIGASGSGKTTLLQIAALLDDFEEGSVMINGQTFKAGEKYSDLHKYRLINMGFIYQNHNLLSSFNARENVAIPLMIDGLLSKNEALEKADLMLEKVGLGKRLYNLPSDLSGGESQRVAVARSLIRDPKIIFADEPTGNLDPKTSLEIFELIRLHAKVTSAAVLMVTHNLKLAEQMDSALKLGTNCALERAL